MFKAGDKVVHLGGALGEASRNRGTVLTILEGPLTIDGWQGVRYIVDKPMFAEKALTADHYHANGRYLLKLK